MTTPLANSLRDALVQRARAQWIALGVDAVGAAESSVVDPEALIALTAEIGEADARLRNTSTDWCVAYGRFVNGTRLRQVVAEIGVSEGAIGEYASTVASAGGPSWRQVGRAREGYRYRGKARLEDLEGLPRLLLRLRAISVSTRGPMSSASSWPDRTAASASPTWRGARASRSGMLP